MLKPSKLFNISNGSSLISLYRLLTSPTIRLGDLPCLGTIRSTRLNDSTTKLLFGDTGNRRGDEEVESNISAVTAGGKNGSNFAEVITSDLLSNCCKNTRIETGMSEHQGTDQDYGESVWNDNYCKTNSCINNSSDSCNHTPIQTMIYCPITYLICPVSY